MIAKGQPRSPSPSQPRSRSQGLATRASALALLANLIWSTPAMLAQALPYNPPPTAGFFNAGLGWLPLATTSTTSPLAYAPPPTGIYAQNSSGQWVPWDGTGSSPVSPGTPTCIVGPAAGTGATCAVLSGSTNQVGQLTLALGSPTQANATLVTLTFGGTVTTAPLGCLVQPRNAEAALLTSTIYTTAPSITAWTLADGATVPTNSSTAIWYYLCF